MIIKKLDRWSFKYILLICICTGNFAKAQTDIDKVILDSRNDMLAGKNIKIPSQFSNLPLVEPTIAAHPVDKDCLVAAAMVVTDVNRPYQSCRLSSFVTSDGGITWKETAHDYWGYDPWIAMLSNGKTSLSWLGTPKSFQHRFPLQIFTSLDAGTTWSNNVESFNGLGHGHDGTKLIAHGNSFYLTTVRFNGDMSADVVLYTSTSNGFKEAASVKGNGKRLNFCEPAVLSNGNVIVPTLHYNGKIWANVYNPKTKALSPSYEISQNPKLGRGYARMASDTSSASAFSDRIYFVRAVADGRSSKGVWLNFSKDNGKSWSIEKRIDLFDDAKTSKANVASVAVNNKGIVGVSWVDGQEDPAQKAYDVYFTISKDGGVSFQRPLKITSVSSNPRTRKNADVANKFIGGGHYLGITTKADGSFQLIWSDSREGIFVLQTNNIQIL